MEYDKLGDQTVSAETYGNLIFSGSGEKSMATGTSVSGNLSIAPTGTAKASVGTGLNLSVGSLTLGGLGQRVALGDPPLPLRRPTRMTTISLPPPAI